MRKIITFLGKQARKTSYQYAGECYQGEIFAQVLHQFCEFDQMLVCVTPEARTATWTILERMSDPRIVPVDIAAGRSDAEMWQLFQQIVQHIECEDEVIFDITHGLRSLPFLVFLFAAYLKTAKSVTIKAIYYGAFELGTETEPAPVIELSSFVQMLDWLTATNRFTETGDGRELARLLESRQGEALRDCASKIEVISRALGATRPLEAIEAAAGLGQVLSQAEQEIEQAAQPFALLSNRVLQEYGQFAITAIPERQRQTERLLKQFQMIGWYIERQQIVQAATLAREWVISVLMVYLNQPDRRAVNLALGCALAIWDKRKPVYPKKTSFKEKVEQIWQEVELRNDLAHCGMGNDPKSAIELEDEMKQLYQRLKQEVLILLNS